MTPMAETAQDAGGVINSVRRLAGSLLVLVQTRLELFGVELREEKLRAVNLLLWLCAAVAFGVAGVLIAFGALAWYLWQTVGYLGLLGAAAGALAVAAAIILLLRRRLLRGVEPFAETVSEFRKDVEWLRPRE
jgi:uncharacterized membrane protein YqjE